MASVSGGHTRTGRRIVSHLVTHAISVVADCGNRSSDNSMNKYFSASRAANMPREADGLQDYLVNTPRKEPTTRHAGLGTAKRSYWGEYAC
jgi:hypothetical protein